MGQINSNITGSSIVNNNNNFQNRVEEKIMNLKDDSFIKNKIDTFNNKLNEVIETEKLKNTSTESMDLSAFINNSSKLAQAAVSAIGNENYLQKKIEYYSRGFSDVNVTHDLVYALGADLGIIDFNNYSQNNYKNVNEVTEVYPPDASVDEIRKKGYAMGGYSLGQNSNEITLSYTTGCEYTDPSTGNSISLVMEENGSYTMTIKDSNGTKEYPNVEKMTTADFRNIYQDLSTYNPNKIF